MPKEKSSLKKQCLAQIGTGEDAITAQTEVEAFDKNVQPLDVEIMEMRAEPLKSERLDDEFDLIELKDGTKIPVSRKARIVSTGIVEVE